MREPAIARFRILSLDGGGAWALLQIMALQELYDVAATGHAIVRDFDLIAGNSGGSIVAAGLYEGLPLAAMLELFLDEGRRRSIFRRRWFLPYWFSTMIGIGARYRTDAKLEGLRAAFARVGGRTLPEAVEAVTAGSRRAHLLITSFDYDRQRAVYVRSNLSSRSASGPADYLPTIAEAVHASSNAPVNYFDEPAAVGGGRYWDGAIAGLNNPALAAVVEAIAIGAKPADIDLLSIGTGTVTLPLAGVDGGAEDPALLRPLARSWLLPDLKELAQSILDDPPDAASFVAYVLLGQPLPPGPQPTNPAFVRMNPVIRPVWDAAGELYRLPPGLPMPLFRALKDLDLDAARQTDVEAICQLGRAWIADRVPNQPIRFQRRTYAPQIGYDRFTAAKQAWENRPR